MKQRLAIAQSLIGNSVEYKSLLILIGFIVLLMGILYFMPKSIYEK